MDIHGTNITYKYGNRICYIFIMYDVMVRMELSIILFYHAGGGAGTAFQPRLEVL